ncbi:aldo/keto reductase [Trebonia sp.]|uniref:aldo/keto reductase n=1 Tax=Trebonia sp. TaxID=2767075 RepID=UPI003BAEB16F
MAELAKGGHPPATPPGLAKGGHPPATPPGLAKGGHPPATPPGLAKGGHPPATPQGLSQDPFELSASPRQPLVFGGAPIGGLYEPVSDADAAATLAAAWDAGIRAFDTAPHYGVGLSEQRLGDFLAGRPRSEFAICTKVGRRLVPASGPVEGVDEFYGTPALSRVRDYSADGVRRCLEDSLRRLRLDRVDIALIHDPDDFMTQALDSAYPALAGLRAAGVVGAIGVGMNAAAPLAWFVSRADLDCVLVAGRYSLLDTSAAAELLPLCADRGVQVLAGGVFNSGILADPRDGAYYDYAPAPAEVLARARRIRDICAAYSVPVGAAALRFTLRHPAVTAAVVGARSAAEISTDASYLTLDIPDELFAALATVLPQAGMGSLPHGSRCGDCVRGTVGQGLERARH